MIDPSIQERNALGGHGPAEVAGRLSMAVAPDCARFSLRVPDAGRGAAGQCLGFSLPGRIGQVTQDADRMALCLGPDEWMLLAPTSAAQALAAGFGSGMQGAPHSLVDISHREVGILLHGPAASLALRAGCALDIESLPSPWATRTLFDKAQIVLLKQAPDQYRIEVWQSFASHVWGLLDTVRHEIALGL